MSPRRRVHRRAKPDRQRMLEVLASCRDGCTEAILRAHGFSVSQMVEIINAGLATATAERVVAGKREMEIARVRITAAGRKALAATQR
jgi:DNA-binding protein